jgi:hypothetical protein
MPVLRRLQGKTSTTVKTYDAVRLEHDPEKWAPVSRLREARFGGRSKVG